MPNASSAIVQRLWNYDDVLRDEAALALLTRLSASSDAAPVQASLL